MRLSFFRQCLWRSLLGQTGRILMLVGARLVRSITDLSILMLFGRRGALSQLATSGGLSIAAIAKALHYQSH